MEINAKTRTEQILTIMTILAWVAFIGFLIEGGAILYSYIVSCVNPEGAKNLYKGLNLYDLQQFNFRYYTQYVSFMIALPLMKAYLWFIVIKTASKINLKNPFKNSVAKRLEKISYILLATWIVALLSDAYSNWLTELTGKSYGIEVSGESIFVAGLVFIISQVFRRGVEIQSENELTV